MVIPDRITVIPDWITVIPDWITVIPDRFAVIPDQFAVSRAGSWCYLGEMAAIHGISSADLWGDRDQAVFDSATVAGSTSSRAF